MAVAPVSRSSVPRLTLEGLNTIIGTNYKMIDNQHQALFTTKTSNKRYEEDTALAGMGSAPTKREGEAVFYDMFQETWTSRYEHDTIAIGFMTTEESKEDNLYIDMATKGAMWMGRSMANTKQQRAANVLNNGFNSSITGGDGVPLFSASHPTLRDGNQSNYYAIDLSEDALENMVIGIKNTKDETGILINAQAQGLFIPPALEFKAYRILNADKRVATADNDPNALRGRGALSSSINIINRLTDTDAFFIKTDVPEALKHFQRVGLSTKNEGDFDTGNFKYKARERYSFGWSDWRGIVGSEGA